MALVGALKKRGWHGLRVHCRSCNTVHVLILAYLRLPDEADTDKVIPRLRCRDCGTRPEHKDVTPYFLDTATAHGSGAPPNRRSHLDQTGSAPECQ